MDHVWTYLGSLFCQYGYHWNRTEKSTGIHRYVICAWCSLRSYKVIGSAWDYQPVDTVWMETGLWYKPSRIQAMTQIAQQAEDADTEPYVAT